MSTVTLHESASEVASLAARASLPLGASPLAAATAHVLPPVAAVTPSGGGLAPILVADDDPDDRYFIRRLITKTGTEHPIRTFEDGSEVVNYLGAIAAGGPDVRRLAPKLLFLDLKMTGLGGFGFLEWARAQKSALPMTIVVLSNSAEPADMAQAMALGAHRYLVKYPSVNTFGTIIRSVYPLPLVK